jgi:hypothetical protein
VKPVVAGGDDLADGWQAELKFWHRGKIDTRSPICESASQTRPSRQGLGRLPLGRWSVGHDGSHSTTTRLKTHAAAAAAARRPSGR